MPTSFPSWRRSVLTVRTCTPLRRTLGYGPAAMTMLSPATDTTCTASGLARLGNLMVQPVVSVVAVKTYVTSVLSPASFLPVTFHLPATSLSLIAAGGGAGSGAAGGVAAAVVVSGVFSVLAQAATATAQESRKSERIRSSREARGLRKATLSMLRRQAAVSNAPMKSHGRTVYAPSLRMHRRCQPQ